ncbi:MAG: RpiB/LacA/LacB family sugar-phosphate isomerase [Candidatus Micrarchaeia archaeon]
MKVFIASENVRHGILLSNVLNAFGVNTLQSDSAYSDTEALIRDLLKNAQSSDVCFAISSKPIDLSIDANKAQGIRAAYCKDSSDIASARKAGANVIVLDAANASKENMQAIISGWLSGEVQGKGIAKSLYKPISQKDQEGLPSNAEVQKAEKKKVTINIPSNGASAKDKKNENEEDDMPRGKGIIRKIKYSLGIE